MTTLEKYNGVFKKLFSLNEEQLNEQLVYQGIPAWDSIGHMEMVAELEDVFGIMLETEDIIDFSSYTKGIEIIQKYGVEF